MQNSNGRRFVIAKGWDDRLFTNIYDAETGNLLNTTRSGNSPFLISRDLTKILMNEGKFYVLWDANL